MMRLLASLIAVCLVAAAGVHPAAAASGRPRVVEVSRGVANVATVATLGARGIDAAPPGRTDSSQLSRAVLAAASQASRASGPAGARAPAPDLPAILVGDPVALAPRLPSAADPAAPSSHVVSLRWLSTHAARGPPIV
ncbi:MAG TPA: hypothetical protein VLM79_36980 [Kofleriaceae bacterium]|nr:hypothetical protein [Kofleriaceae bacterium]